MSRSTAIKWFLPAAVALGFLVAVSCKGHKQNSKKKAASPTTVTKKNSETSAVTEAPKAPTKSDASIRSKYAEVLGVSPKEIKNEKLYTTINDWYGVPYKYGGKDKKGIDCSGFTAMLYQSVYNKKISPATKYLVEETEKINSSALKEGDLVFFNIADGKISHVGVYLQNNKFVHASTKKGVMINDLNEAYYKKYFCRAGRVK